MTTVIVGVGFVATLTLISAGTMSNAAGAERTTGVNLARNIRELTLQKKFSQLQAFNGKVYTPAVDGRGVALDQLSGWTQSVTVQPVNYNWLTVASSDPAPVALRLSVSVTHNGRKVTGVSWYAFDGTP